MGGFEACHTTLLVQLCDVIKMILMLRSEASLWAAFGPVTASESGSVTRRRFTDISRPISQDPPPFLYPAQSRNAHIPRLPHSSLSSGTPVIFQNADKRSQDFASHSTSSHRRPPTPPLRSLSTNRCSDEYLRCQTSDSQREKVVPVRSVFFLLRAQD